MSLWWRNAFSCPAGRWEIGFLAWKISGCVLLGRSRWAGMMRRWNGQSGCPPTNPSWHSELEDVERRSPLTEDNKGKAKGKIIIQVNMQIWISLTTSNGCNLWLDKYWILALKFWNRFVKIWYDIPGFPLYHMFPVMSSAPRGKFNALSLYSFRGLSPEKHFPFPISLGSSFTNDLKIIIPVLLLPWLNYHIGIFLNYLSLTVHCVEGVGFLFGCCFWSTDDLQHWALWLRSLRGQRVVVRIPFFICLRTGKVKRKWLFINSLLADQQYGFVNVWWVCGWFHIGEIRN